MAFRSDLDIDLLSQALLGKTLDLLVTGSIGAVESVRFCRALRRLGAQVQVWMSEGAHQFTTETALAWASARPVRSGFSGHNSHLAENDACVIAPASASFIAKLANGMSDSHTAALACSYMGQNKPVLVLPNMHDSLKDSPMINRNIESLTNHCIMLDSRREEGKQKFPDPKVLADEVAHHINRPAGLPTLIVMGTTRAYIDDVRYLSNYSSGALGTTIAEELYRSGFATHIVNGPSQYSPASFTTKHRVETNEEMKNACLQELEASSPLGAAKAVVMLASVLDFVPQQTQSGKIRSHQKLDVDFIRTEKIIAALNPSSGLKVGFKLEAAMDAEQALQIARDYFDKYQLSMMVLNQLKDVDADRHRAFIVSRDKDLDQLTIATADSKPAIAALIKQHLLDAIPTD